MIAVRSGEGVGGLLAGIDLAPMLKNHVVTDRTWRVYTEWDDRLLKGDVGGLDVGTPQLLGMPPAGRWNYPVSRKGSVYGDQQFLAYPVRSWRVRGALPETRTIGGIAVSSTRPASALVFDFGEIVSGRPRIEVKAAEAEVIRLQYVERAADVNPEAEFHSLVIAPGESSVTDPLTRRFRYVAVYEANGSVTAVRDAAAN